MKPATTMGPALSESRLTKALLGVVAAGFLGLLLLVPLAIVLYTGFREGFDVWQAAVTHPDTRAALELTLLVVVIAVPINTFFGLAAAWALTKHEFRGRGFLLAMIDLPFSVSPVISGMVFVLLFGSTGVFGAFLMEHDIKIVFAVPGIVLATLFVTFPFVAREIIPAMDARGKDQELAALTLGASGWQTFWRVTVPNIKWALFHGVVLCTARAVGEFGAVSVVSGHIVGETNTTPLHIEYLYNGHEPHSYTAAFAVSTLLLALALLTIVAKYIIHRLESRR